MHTGNKLDVYAFNTTPTPSLKLVSSQPLYASGSAIPTGVTRCYLHLQLTKYSQPLVGKRTSSRDTSLSFLSPPSVRSA